MNTTHFKNLIMGNVFRTDTSVNIPTSYYIGLSSSEPTIEGLNVTEPSTVGTGYARVLLKLKDIKKEKQSELRVAYRRTITRLFTVLRTVTLTVTLTFAITTPPFNMPPLPYGSVVVNGVGWLW